MYGLGQFHHRQNKGEERKGKIWQKKQQQLLSKHRAAADGKNRRKIADCCHMDGRPLQIHQTTAA